MSATVAEEPHGNPRERADEYEALYRDFNSPLMRQIRREAYGEDIGQHSFVRAIHVGQIEKVYIANPHGRQVSVHLTERELALAKGLAEK